MKRSALIILVTFLLLAFNSQTMRLAFAKIFQENQSNTQVAQSRSEQVQRD
jgi:hypothetical protein